MKAARIIPALLAPVILLASCTESKHTVSGSMKFVVGGTSGTVVPAPFGPSADGAQAAPLIADDEYIVSPRKAKITFVEVVFIGSDGIGLGVSDLTDCTVEYNRSLTSGSSLLNCPFTAPVGEVGSMILYYVSTIDLLVSDATIGIYSDPAAATKYSTTMPAGGAAYVPLTITIGGGVSRGAIVAFAAPITVAEGSSPSLYVTVDMIHTVQLKVNAGGTTLTAHPLTDPVALFAGLTPGTSKYYSGATSAEGYKVQGVPSLRVFYDNAGNPLYSMIGPNFCGVDAGSPKGAWAIAPNGAKMGGWLGKDASNNVAWALATSDAWTTYNAYYLMADVSVVGQTTSLLCKVTTTPPPPADGKTYASGAPVLTAPDKTVTLRLLSK